jgi:hypothetical protein
MLAPPLEVVVVDGFELLEHPAVASIAAATINVGILRTFFISLL